MSCPFSVHYSGTSALAGFGRDVVRTRPSELRQTWMQRHELLLKNVEGFGILGKYMLGSDLLDINAAGRRVTLARLPSRRSDGSPVEIRIPIVTIVGTPGPTLLVIAGTHGDEYDGQLIALDLARRIDPARLQGRVIVVPVLNGPASETGSRLSPIDGRDLNRTYPGDGSGTASQALADFVVRGLLPESDFAIDLHSGGLASEFVPCCMMQGATDAGLEAKMRAAVDAFAAPYSIRFIDTGAMGSIETGGTFERAALDLGVPAISTELGGSGVVTPQTMGIGRAGIGNLMAHLGMIEAAANSCPAPARLLQCTHADQYALAPRDGLWEPLVLLGDRVAAGEPVSRLYDPGDPLAEPGTIAAPSNGIVIARRTPARCRQGDFLVITAREP